MLTRPAVVGVDCDIPLKVLAARPAFSLQLRQPSTQDPRHGRVTRVPLGVIVGVPQPVLLALGEALVVAVLGVVPVLGQLLAVVVVLGQVPGVLVPGVRETGVVLRVVLARDGVETGVVPVPISVLWMLNKGLVTELILFCQRFLLSRINFKKSAFLEFGHKLLVFLKGHLTRPLTYGPQTKKNVSKH